MSVTPMEMRQFGRHPLLVSELGLGCAKLSPFAGSIGFSMVERVVKRAIERGITFFDTADSYGAGFSERWLGRAVRQQRGRVTLATKCGRPSTIAGKVLNRLCATSSRLPLPDMVHPDYLFSNAYIEAALLKSLRRLGTDYVDIYMLHSPPQEALLNGTWVEVLTRLRARGLIRLFGISARSIEDALTAIRDYNVDCVEVEINPCTLPDARPLLELARASGTAVIARQVFGSGALLEGLAMRLERPSIADARSQAAAALLQFAYAIPEITVVLAGMSTVHHVDLNTSAPSRDLLFSREISELVRELCPRQCRSRGEPNPA